MTKNIIYNDIDLGNWKNYKNVITNTVLEKSIDVYEQILKRYTKKNDLILCIECNLEEKHKANRNIVTPDIYNKQEKLQFIQADIHIKNNIEVFNEELINEVKNFSEYLEENKFLAILTNDVYYNNELHLYSYKYVEILQKAGLKLKNYFIRQLNCDNKSKSQDLWRYRALRGGFNVINHDYIFIFQK